MAAFAYSSLIANVLIIIPHEVPVLNFFFAHLSLQ